MSLFGITERAPTVGVTFSDRPRLAMETHTRNVGAALRGRPGLAGDARPVANQTSFWIVADHHIGCSKSRLSHPWQRKIALKRRALARGRTSLPNFPAY